MQQLPLFEESFYKQLVLQIHLMGHVHVNDRYTHLLMGHVHVEDRFTHLVFLLAIQDMSYVIPGWTTP